MDPVSAIRIVSPEAGAGFPAKVAENLAVQGPVGLAGAPGSVTGAGDSFSGLLGQMVQEVNSKQLAAGEAVNGLLSGQGTSLHQAIIAMEEASVSFQLMVEVRNKLLESYQELMRMQI
jgi:flagellar hook-basal body complex protein FliE